MGEFLKGGSPKPCHSIITKMVIHDLDDLEYPPFRKPPYEDGIFFGTSGGRLLPRESGFGHPLMAVCSYRLEEESRMMVG